MAYWRGKRAVVIGASAGLGRALAEVLVERGARVAITGRGESALHATAEELRSGGGDVLALAGDATVQDDVDRLARRLADEWGGVDFVGHCAGRSTRGTVLDTPPDEFRAMWELNFLSAVRAWQAFARSLVPSRGHFVLVGSLASKVAPRFLGPYPASKFSLAALAQQLRLEHGDEGLHVLLVCPGPIARADAAPRYADESSHLPAEAQLPGGGAKLSAIDPRWLAERILRACERRHAELIVPGRSRLLFALAHLSPRLGDWLLRKMTAG